MAPLLLQEINSAKRSDWMQVSTFLRFNSDELRNAALDIAV